MKKITSGILIALMITIALSGCGNRQKDEAIEESSSAPSVEDSSSTDETEEVKEEDTVDNTSEAKFDPNDFSEPDKFKDTRIVGGNLVDKNGHVLAKLDSDDFLYYAARIDSNGDVYDKDGNHMMRIPNDPASLG